MVRDTVAPFLPLSHHTDALAFCCITTHDTEEQVRRERRRRGPARSGRRTTLTLPADVVGAAERLADELDTSANDAVVRLARLGVQRQEAIYELEDRVNRRRAALLALSGETDGSQLPDADEARSAMLALRREQ